MGIYKQGWFGAYTGRVGNVIGTMWNGRAVLRIRPASVANPNTLAQQAQRMKFRLAASFIKLHEKLIRIGFAAKDQSITPFNNAMRYNIANAITGTFPTLSLDLTKVKISDGNLPNLKAPLLTSVTPATVKIDWTDNTGSIGAKATDKLLLSIVDAASNEVFIADPGAVRLDEAAVVALPTEWSGRTVTVIGFLVSGNVQESADTTAEVATSVTYGTVTIA